MNLLLAWELGGNWGHLARDLPVLRRLQAEGHDVLYAVREQHLAPARFASSGIPCVAAPTGAAIRRIPRNLAGYAAILFADGFGDAAILAQRLAGWINLFAEHETDVLLADYAPGALLAARVAGIPSVTCGSGFEIPPDVASLPSFLTNAAQDEAARRFSEGLVLFNVNQALHRLGRMPLERLAQAFQGTRNVFTTFAELDHIADRAAGALYAGAVQDVPGGMAAGWNGANTPRVLMYLREMGPAIDEVLHVLDGIGAEVIAVLPDAGSIRRVHADARVFRQPVRFDGLLGTAVLVIASGSGTITSALLAGVPVLALPTTAEQAMFARRVQAMGAGIAADTGTVAGIAGAIHRFLTDATLRTGARRFAAQYAGCSTESAIHKVIDATHDAARSRPWSMPS